jgi:hypothetical protein
VVLIPDQVSSSSIVLGRFFCGCYDQNSASCFLRSSFLPAWQSIETFGEAYEKSGDALVAKADTLWNSELNPPHEESPVKYYFRAV